MEKQDVLIALWRAVADQNREEMLKYFTPDALICWHCTGEQFTLEEYLRANCEYPGQWRGEVERIEETADGAALAARVWAADGSSSFHCAAFYRFRNGKIFRADEYWGDDGPPPEWRREKGIGRPIKG